MTMDDETMTMDDDKELVELLGLPHKLDEEASEAASRPAAATAKKKSARPEGSLRRLDPQRYPKRWTLVFDAAPRVDPATGHRRRRQKTVTFDGTWSQAKRKLRDLKGKVDRGELPEPTKLTLGEWLIDWLERVVKVKWRDNTYTSYKHIIDSRIMPAVGARPLATLDEDHLAEYYKAQADGAAGLAPATLQLHHALLSSALKAAVRKQLIAHNVAARVEHKPHAEREPDAIANASWTADEARAFLAEAQTAGPQAAAFYRLALDTGCRKGELFGAKWTDLDFGTGRIAIRRQLLDHGKRKRGASRGVVTAPTTGLTKTDKGKSRESRVLDLSAKTIAWLRVHKQQQAELKMRNRDHYHDLGFMFAREPADLYGHPEALGLPLPPSGLADRTFKRLTKAAHLRPIPFHGLRHSMASIALALNVPMKVVQERLGHKKIAITMDLYSHVAPGMQAEAAAKLGAALDG
jgi:integrase